ncbi:hypothetical protein [Streptomyces roseolus]|uniref:hypothetical protein n=1 Tax=Streptomyces roseolus TaxID=67358 RepID=UPI001989267F|nr:hypothetical protein [Streptomyces roseolus]GGR61174.1 hypothetical protein GCM10010282_62800 [Streptomyces roseolus]
MWWGVAAALTANVLYSVGFVLEKRALGGLPALSAGRPVRAVAALLTSPLWTAGALALAAGFAAQLFVYRALPIAAAQGVFVSGLVLLLLLSSSVLGERPSGRERRAVGAVLVALLMVVASVREDDEVASGDVPWGVALSVSVPTLAAGVALYGQVERRARRRHRVPTNGIGYGVAVGLLYGVSSLAVKGVSVRLAAADAAGAAGALLGSPYPYLLLFTAGAGLVMSQTALQRCRATLIVPVCTTVTCLFTAVVGTLAYGERLPDDPLLLVLRTAGTALALFVLLLLPRHDPPPARAPGPPSPRPRRRRRRRHPSNSEDPRVSHSVHPSPGARRHPAPHPGLPPRQGPAHADGRPGRPL